MKYHSELEQKSSTIYGFGYSVNIKMLATITVKVKLKRLLKSAKKWYICVCRIINSNFTYENCDDKYIRSEESYLITMQTLYPYWRLLIKKLMFR